MATIQEYIERLIYQFTSQGADKVATDMNAVAAAQTTTSTSALSLEKSFDSLERRYVTTVRAAQDYANVQAKVAAAVAQNPALQERANVVLAAATDRYGQATRAQTAYATAMGGMQSQLIAMAGGLGLVGTTLAAFGPAGLAAAVGLKLVSDAINEVRETAQRAGQGSAALVSLSEATRLSIDEIRVLKKEAAQFGVGGEQIETWLQRAAIGMEHAREGSGELADALTKINPVFLEQMQAATSMAQRLDILANAAKAAKEQGKDVALFWRDVFGRGSARADPVMAAIVDKGGVQQSAAAMKSYGGVVEDVIRQQAELSRSIEAEEKKRDALNSVLMQSRNVLQLELDALKAGNAARQHTIDLLAQEKQQRADNIASLESEVQARIKGSDAEEIVNRARQRNRVPGAAPTVRDLDRGMALQEGETPKSAITGVAEATAKAVKDQALAATQAANDMSRWVSALGAAATTGEKTELAILKLTAAYEANAFGAKDSTEATERYQRALAEVERQANSTDTAFKNQIQTIRARTATEREAAEAAQAIANAPSGSNRALAGERAITLEREKQAASHRDAMAAGASELAVASARTQSERLAAQEAQKYLQLIREGRTASQAAAEAAQQRAIAEAAITVEFEKQLAMAQAVTQAQKIALMDTNEQAVALAEANSNVERQTESLRQQNEMAQARLNNTEAGVAAEQAWTNAIRAGADAEHAAALASQTRLQFTIQAQQKEQQQAEASQKRDEAEDAARNARSAAAAKQRFDEFTSMMKEGAQRGSEAIGQAISDLESFGDYSKSFFRSVVVNVADVDGLVRSLKQQLKQDKANKDLADKQQEARDKAQAERDRINQAIDQANLELKQLQITNLPDEQRIRAEADLKYQEEIKAGVPAALARQIADQQMANALAELNSSVKDNTSATQSNTDALSPLYATDPRLSHLGFRAGSSALDYDPFAQPKSGAGGPAALPFGSSATPAGTANEPIYVQPVEPPGHWVGGGAGPMTWVGSGPPDYSDISYKQLQQRQESNYLWARDSTGLNPASEFIAAPGWGTPDYNPPATPAPGRYASAPSGVGFGPTWPSNPQQQRQRSGATPILITQNFLAPVERGVASEMKITAFQGAQSGLRSSVR